MEHTVVVVGGGVAGLAVSYEILERTSQRHDGIRLVCLESADRPGGNIRTSREDGFVCEWGPNGFLDNVPATVDLVRRLGIASRLLPSNREAAKRFLFRGGKLRKLPAGVLSFLTADILSWSGKLRVFTEPFRGAPPPGWADESVYDFASRRIGEEAAGALVDAMVSGIYAGDVRRLSIRSTFPKLWKMEAEHGGLVRAMLARRREPRPDRVKGGSPAGPGGTLTSFQNGLDELTDALAASLGRSLRLNASVQRISDMGTRGFRVEVAEGPPLDAHAVVLACPAWHAAPILREMDTELAATVREIPSASLAVVHFGFDESEIGGRLDGFGYLVPRGEGVRILGTLWSSSIFPLRAPAGKVLLTTMIGGAHDPGAATLPEDRLVDLVRTELRATMGIAARPTFVRIFRHPHGIPQYTLGHQARLETIARRLELHPRLFVCGNSYHGISVNACAEEAPKVAEALLESLRPTRGLRAADP